MNNTGKTEPTYDNTTAKKLRIDKKVKEVIFLGVLAFILAVAAWKIFYVDETSNSTQEIHVSETEQKVGLLLSQMEGVGKANVMIYETEEGIESVVVICDGANNLNVVMNIREAVAAALGTQEKSVKIYLKKE